MPLTLRLDPWQPPYDSALQLEEDDEGDVTVDAFVETRDWQSLVPEYRARPETMVFVDGVQRVETRLIGEEDGRLVYGALASYAVGAVFSQSGGARIQAESANRLLALSDGSGEHPSIEVACGSISLRFGVRPSGVTGLKGVHDAITSARRETEAHIGEELAEDGHPLVIVDGRLNFPLKASSRAVGLIKTFHKQYLQGDQLAVLSQLPVRARTPLFHIPRERPVYSWYLRLADQRPAEHPWAGLVRLETLDVVGLQPAVQLADVTALHLPAFASSPAHDPRAPQNLYPLGALEGGLP